MITTDDLDKLRHMLGVSKTYPDGYRNYYCAGGDDLLSMERLCAAGFAVKNERVTWTVGPIYQATVEGAKAVGLAKLPN
jgi:hypothetical protein